MLGKKKQNVKIILNRVCRDANDKKFQIWPQNSNRITFDPSFGSKLSKIGKIPDLANFVYILSLKKFKCYSVRILKPYLESCHLLVSAYI